MYYPYVVKRQIVDYMKYRGLISIGSGFFDKLSTFKELPKQQEVVDKKVEYDDELNEINKACKKVYEAIIDYENCNSELKSYTYNRFVNLLQDGNSEFKGMEAVNMVYLAICKNKAISERITNVGFDSSAYEFDDIVNFFNNDENFKEIIKIKKTNSIENEQELIGYYLDINNVSDDLYAIVQLEKTLYKKYRDKIAKTTDKDEIKQLKDKYDETKDIAKTYSDIASEYINDYNDRYKIVGKIVNDEVEKIVDFLNRKYRLVEKCLESIETANKTLAKLIDEELPKLKAKADVWENSIEKLSEGTVKEDFRLSYNQIDNYISEAQAKTLISRLEKDLGYFKALDAALKKTTFLNYNFITNNKKCDITRLYSNIEINELDYKVIKNKTSEIFRDNYKIDEEIKTVQRLTHKTTAFYKFLVRNYSQDGGSSSNKQILEDNAKKEKDNMMEKVNATISEYENISDKADKEASNKIPDSGEVFNDFATTIFKNVTDKDAENIASSKENKNGSIGSNINIDNAGSIAKEQVKSMDGSLDIIKVLGDYTFDTLEDGRDNVFITEYLTEIFSCYTTEEKEKSLANFEMSSENNYVFGKELEYILWGGKGNMTNANVGFTIASIFGLRFVLNTVYAYTDAEIASFTLAVATAIAGFTGFGVPIVQNVLILALSLGETAMDVVRLLNGENVEIYKSSSTWILKPSSLARETVEVALKKTSEAIINKISKTIEEVANDYTDSKIQQLEEDFDELSEAIIENLQIDLSNMLIAPIEAQLPLIAGSDSLENVNIKSIMESAYSDIASSAKNETVAFVKAIKTTVVNEFIKSSLPDIISKINSMINNVNMKVEDIEKEINETIENVITEVSSTVKEKVFENGYENLKSQVKQSFRGLTGDVKEKINNSIDGFVEKVSSEYSSPSNISGKTNKKIGFNIGMTYKEYIKMFIFIGLITGKENLYISRMIDLIKLNMVMSKNAPAKDFMVNKAYTMIRIDAGTNVKTTFARQTIFKDKNIGNHFSLEYSTVMGY